MNRDESRSVNSHKFLAASKLLLTLLSGFELAVLLVTYGYQQSFPQLFQLLISRLEGLLVLIFFANLILNYLFSGIRHRDINMTSLDIMILLAILLLSISIKTAAVLIVGRQLIVWGQRAARISWIKHFIDILIARPAQLIMVSFLSIIIVGTIFLTLPAATQNGEGAPLLTALFTATSATCVTGLIVVDTGSYFSTFGQIVIVILIQIGGLGIMTLSTSLALIFGRRFGLREQATLQDIFDVPDAVTLKRIIIYIIKLTFWVELVGVVILFWKLGPYVKGFYRELFTAIFHSISAFCNAGFCLFPDSLARFRNDWVVNFTVSGLIIIGGIGFAVVANLIDRENFRYGFRHFIRRLTIHTKIVLILTFTLISVGTLIIFFFEFDNALLELPTGEKLLAAFFQSVTLRTAGFNTIELGHLRNITIFMMIIWMFIGAAPGSTGGGIKVSTLGVLLLTIKALLTGRREVEIFRRTIPQPIVYKSIAIFLVASALLASLFALLLVSEDANFLILLYESTSAFGTVGLSLGVTPHLTSYGQMLIISMMYIGRIGPLTLAYAVGEKTQKVAIKYPDGRIMVG